MRSLSWPASFERREDGEILVSFPDFPEALTSGRDEAAAATAAADALEEVVLAYVAAGRALPRPRPPSRGMVDVPLDPATVARLGRAPSGSCPALDRPEDGELIRAALQDPWFWMAGCALLAAVMYRLTTG